VDGLDFHWKPYGVFCVVPDREWWWHRPLEEKAAGVFCLTHGDRPRVGRGGRIHFPCCESDDGNWVA
jgi:hypothetical protein